MYLQWNYSKSIHSQGIFYPYYFTQLPRKTKLINGILSQTRPDCWNVFGNQEANWKQSRVVLLHILKGVKPFKLPQTTSPRTRRKTQTSLSSQPVRAWHFMWVWQSLHPIMVQSFSNHKRKCIFKHTNICTHTYIWSVHTIQGHKQPVIYKLSGLEWLHCRKEQPVIHLEDHHRPSAALCQCCIPACSSHRCFIVLFEWFMYVLPLVDYLNYF